MSANSPSEQYAESASCSAAPGMPSEETIARALNLAARAMQRQFGANDTEEAIEAAIWQYLRPAFEAKDAEIEALKKLATEHLQARYHAEARERNAHLAVQEERKLADAAEAKLAQALAIATGKTDVEIRRNDDGTIDEVVACGAKVHLEQMDKGSWYLGIYSGAGDAWQFWLYTNRPDRTVIAINDEHSPARSASAAAREETPALASGKERP